MKINPVLVWMHEGGVDGTFIRITKLLLALLNKVYYIFKMTKLVKLSL